MTTDADINTAVASVLSRFPIGSHARCGNGAGTVYAVGWAGERVSGERHKQGHERLGRGLQAPARRGLRVVGVLRVALT